MIVEYLKLLNDLFNKRNCNWSRLAGFLVPNPFSLLVFVIQFASASLNLRAAQLSFFFLNWIISLKLKLRAASIKTPLSRSSEARCLNSLNCSCGFVLCGQKFPFLSSDDTFSTSLDRMSTLIFSWLINLMSKADEEESNRGERQTEAATWNDERS